MINAGGLGYISGPVEWLFSPITGGLDVAQSYYRGRDGFVSPADRQTTDITLFALGGARSALGKFRAAESSGARFGFAASNDYRATFFAANPELKGQVVVHHAVEQQTLKLYPTQVTAAEINSLENLRGIPLEVNSKLHLSTIRKEWNKFYLANPDATKAQLLHKATEIDLKYGTQFNPPLGR